MKLRSAALILLVCSFCFLFGCRHEIVEDPSDIYRGYWECSKIEMEGEVYEDTFPDEEKEIPVAAFYSIAFADDGTGYLQPNRWLYPSGEQKKEGFRWNKEEKGGVTLHGADDNTLFLELIEDQLVLSQDDDFRMWFKKVDKLTEYDFTKQQSETEAAGN